jgi:cell division protein FtsL
MAYEIKVFKKERDDGLVKAIRANASVAYLVPLSPAPISEEIKAVALQHLKASESDFDLYYTKDVLVTTGWNKNTDVFDRAEVWAARHTPEHKPFNFEHNQTDIIGHITASQAVDESMNPIDDDAVIDDLPPKFHVVNGNVIYRAWSDEERQKLMEQTIAEIERGEWYVSMECLFRGFDYGVTGPNGEQKIVARNEDSAFLTKHLRQYGGTGVYLDTATGSQYTIGRVLRNITFSGKGLVRKPANPESVIFNNATAFTSNLGYITTEAVATSSDTQESEEMPEVNPEVQSLQKQVDDLTKRNEVLAAEVTSLKSKGSEETITKLRQDVADRDTTIASLNTQVNTLKDSHGEVVKRAEKAEAELNTANEELTKTKAAEVKRNRLAVLTDKGAKPDLAASLVENLSNLDDTAFAGTVDLLSEGWKSTPPAKPSAAAERDAISQAKPEGDAALATAEEESNRETAIAKTSSYFGSLLSGTKKKESE